MEKIWIKFLKDYETYKVGQVVELEKAVGSSLVSLKFAENATAPGKEILDEAVKGLADSFKSAIAEATKTVVAEATKEIGDSVKKYLPAVAKDHQEDGMFGFKGMGEFVHTVRNITVPGQVEAKHYEKMTNYAKAAGLHIGSVEKAPLGVNTLVDDEGGYLVPEQTSNRIWDYVVEAQEILPRTDRRTTSSNNLNINGFEELSLKDGYRDSGVRAYWIDEAAEYTRSQPHWKKQRLELKKLGVLIYVTEEEIADAIIALNGVLERKAGNAINWLVNDSFINGSGVGKPLGILNGESNATITVPTQLNQGTALIRHLNINDMYYRMLPEMRKRAVWMVHPNVEPFLSLMAFNDETSSRFPVYLPPGGLTGVPYSTLYGRPVIPSQFCQDAGTPGDIIFVDWSQYITLTKPNGGIKQSSSIHVRFLFDEQVFKFSFRIDGQPAWSHSLEDYRGTTTRSPYIILGDRTTASESTGI